MFPTKTLPHYLQHWAEHSALDRGYTFVGEDGVRERYFSFHDLGIEVARYGKALLRLGLTKGERVAMIIPEGDQFVLTFLGAMHAGLVPVPMCPPMTLGKLGNYLGTARHIVRKSEAAALICTAQVQTVVGSLLEETGTLRTIATVDELPIDNETTPLANITNDDYSFIQFTSGSTSNPKGVVLTHGNLSANAHCIMNLGLNATPEDRGGSWLPFYHDMGLIGFVLAPLLTETPVAFMQPLAFLKRPVDWFRMITRHKSTIGFGPNFAYGLCTSRIKEKHLEGIDLSSWRIAGCGAEPIQLDVLDKFASRFEAVGFNPTSFMPAFGMAESTLAVTFWDLDKRPTADRVRLDKLSTEHVAEPAEETGDFETGTFVNCGKAFPGHDVKIMAEDGSLLDDRQIGEIVIKGPSVMTHYYKDEETTQQTIRDGWLHTGDKGYLVDGDLFVCGRIKEMIIIAGKNYYPTDLEWACNDVPGVRKGNVVAFGLGGFGDKERVVVTVETKADPEQWDDIAKNVRSKILKATGLKVDEVLMLEPGSLPKTSSGKLQRRKTKQWYVEGKLENASKGDGRIGMVKHLAQSQWSLLKHRVRRVTGNFLAG